MKTIWIILRSSIHTRRPIMSVVKNLLELNFKVKLLSIESARIDHPNLTEFINPVNISASPFGKLHGYYNFRRYVKRVLSKNAEVSDILWLGSLDTINLCTGLRIINEHKYICHIHELYDTKQSRLRISTHLIRNASKVVVPEVNRAKILRTWLKLETQPTVYPNKPATHPRVIKANPTTSLTKEIVSNIDSTKKIVLYQGHIGHDRDLKPIAEAVKDLDNVEFWLMGKDHGCVEELVSISDKVKYLGFIPAPYHLEITSYAHLGIMSYNLTNLNNLYCAPNKVWEYLGFNIFFICNEVGSLESFVSRGCCELVDFYDIDKVKQLIINNIDKKQDFSNIYDSIDTKEIILECLSDDKI